MARKARKKSTARVKKKRTRPTRVKRKPARQRRPAPKKAARKTKGPLSGIADRLAAVIETLEDAERLHGKLEPHPARDQEPE